MRTLSIHHVITGLTVGGAETLLCWLAGHQAAAGHRVAAHAVAGLGRAAQELTARGIPVHSHASSAPLRSLVQLFRLFRKSRPDVVHCHNVGPTLLAAPAARLARVPCVISTRHGGSLSPAATERKFWLAARLCDHVVAVSRSAAQRLASAPWACPSKLTVILNGAAAPSIPPGVLHAPGDPNAFRLVTVARLDPIKDFANLLRAVALAAPALPGLSLWIVGDGPERPRLEKLITELGLRNRVELLGERSDVGPWLARSHVFVLSSLSEGVPIALLEAMAVGLPAIVTEVGGMPEVIRCCGSGRLVPPSRPDAFAQAILELARDAERRLSLGQAARNCHARHFTLERMAGDYFRLYCQTLGRKR
ncbi:MAG: glycosyltransferase [Bryobacteraceae bacterium]